MHILSGRPTLYKWFTIIKVLQPDQLPPSTQINVDGRYYFKSLNNWGKNARGGGWRRPRRLPSHILPQQPKTLSHHPNQICRQDRLTVQLRRRSRGLIYHQHCLPRNHFTNGHQEWKSSFKAHPTNGRSRRRPIFCRQSQQWYHIGERFWSKRWWLRICGVAQKFARKLVQPSVAQNINWRYCWDAWWHQQSARSFFHYQSALHLAPRAQPNGARRHRYNTNRNPMRQWYDAAAPDPAIPAKLTPNRLPGIPDLPSSTYPRGCERRHPPSKRERPWGIFPRHCQWCALWRLPGFYSPKFQLTHGWSNWQGW